MSSRPQINPHKVIDAGDMSGDIVSEVTILQKMSMVSYDIAWAGTSPVGTLSVEVSNSYEQNGDGSVRTAGNWQTLTLSDGSTSIAVSGDTGNGFIDVDLTAAYAIRLKFTFTSGIGSLTAIIAGKVS